VKKLFLIFALFTSLACAQTSVTQLPWVVQFTDDDYVVIIQDGTTKRFTYALFESVLQDSLLEYINTGTGVLDSIDAVYDLLSASIALKYNKTGGVINGNVTADTLIGTLKGLQDSLNTKAKLTQIGSFADTIYVKNKDALKANITYVDSLYNVPIVYIRLAQAVKDSISKKANKVYVDPLYDSVAVKSNTSYVNNQLALKADLTDIASFVDSAYVQSLITAGATDTTYVKNTIHDSLSAFILYYAQLGQNVKDSIAAKANNDYVIALKDRLEDSLAIKTNLTYTNTQLGTKADTSAITAINDSLALKANKTDVENSLALKADLEDVIVRDNIEPFIPSTEYAPTTKKYVDSALAVQRKYLSNIAEQTIDWREAFTFYQTLGANTVLNIVNPVEGKEIAIAVENPDTFSVSFNAPNNYTILWESGAPTLTDSSVGLFKFNVVGSYILGLAKGEFALPKPVEPSDTTSPSVGAYTFWADNDYTNIYYVNTSKFQVLDGRTLPAGNVLAGNNTYRFKMTRGEKKGMSFLIGYKGKDILDITAEPTAFTGDSGTIAATNFDVWFMPVWWQAEINGQDNQAAGILTQEVFVKNPDLIRTDYSAYNNYIQGIQLSSADGTTGTISYKNVNTAFPKFFKIQDSTSLQPFDITTTEQRHKQLWIDMSIPANQKSGVYYGAIKVYRDNKGDSLATIPVKITVNEFDYSAVAFFNGVYYRGGYSPTYYNSASGTSADNNNNWYHWGYKDSVQLRKEFESMKEVGILYPQSNVGYTNVTTERLIRTRAGLPTDKAFIANSGFQSLSQAWQDYTKGLITLSALNTEKSDAVTTIGQFRTALMGAGLSEANIYYYGHDEANTSTYGLPAGAITTMQAATNTAAHIRATYPNARFWQATSPYGNNFEQASAWLDIPVMFMNSYDAYYGPMEDAEVQNWLGVVDEVWGYNHPQLGYENAEVYRRNYGWLAMKRGLTGNYGWQWTSTQGLWYHDKDGGTNGYRDPAPIYPLYHGYLSTLCHKGLRDAYYDMRYWNTLESKVNALPSGTLKSNALTWMNTFKNWIGVNVHTAYPHGGIDGDYMETLRDTLIGYINYIDNGGGEVPSNWYDGFASYKTVTVASAKISGTNSDFPVTLDLSIMDSVFWANVKSDGSDIAVADNGLNKLQRQVRGFDKANKKGVLYFKAPVLSPLINVFRVYYNNATASEVNEANTFRSEYALVLGFNEAYNALADYTSGKTITIGSGRIADDRVAGKVGYAADFDNSNLDTISVAYDAALNLGTGDITLSGYIKVNASASAVDNILYQRGTDGYRWFIDNDANTLGFRIYGGGIYDAVSTSGTLKDNTWKYIASAVDRNVNVQFYLNGATYGSSTALASITGNILGAVTTIGSSREGGAYYGQMDELRVYRGVLSADWILTEYNNLNDQSTFFTITN
jgi:hypothetical protein